MIFWFLVISAFLHPIFLSHTEIEYKKTDRRLEGSLQIFLDDLENKVLKLNDIELNQNNYTLYKDRIEVYIKEHLKIEVNDKNVKYNIEDIVFRADEFHTVYFLFKANNIAKIKRLVVSNTILTQQIAAQKNYISFREDEEGFKKNVTFKGKESVVFK